MDEEQAERENPTQPLSAEEEQRAGGRPTTGGMAPGGAPTGLRHAHGVPSQAAGGVEGPASGGTLATGAGGGSGTGAGGLGTGLAGTGGTRNIPHNAVQPGGSAGPGETGRPPLRTTDEGLHLQDRPATAPGEPDQDAPSGAESGEASSRSGSAAVEPEQAPSTSVRGTGTGRR